MTGKASGCGGLLRWVETAALGVEVAALGGSFVGLIS